MSRREGAKTATKNGKHSHLAHGEAPKSINATSTSELGEVALLSQGNEINSEMQSKDEDIQPEKMNSASMAGSSTDFESFYLRTITKELSDDLDKIRSANDFSEKSVPILIHALQQGHKIFSDEEKEIMRAAR